MGNRNSMAQNEKNQKQQESHFDFNQVAVKKREFQGASIRSDEESQEPCTLRTLEMRNEEMQFISNNKIELRQQVYLLRDELTQKDKLLHLMAAEIQSLQRNLKLEKQNNLLLSSQFDHVRNEYFHLQNGRQHDFIQLNQSRVDHNLMKNAMQSISGRKDALNSHSESSDFMIEETKQEKQKMMLPVSTGHAAKNAQRQKMQSQTSSSAFQVQKKTSNCVQRSINPFRTQIQADEHSMLCPSASPSSQPIQIIPIAQRSQFINLMKAQGPTHEPILKNNYESAPQSSISSYRKDQNFHQKVADQNNTTLIIAEEESLQKQADPSISKASNVDVNTSPVDMKINDEYNSNAAKKMLLQNHSEKLAQNPTRRKSSYHKMNFTNEKRQNTKNHGSKVLQTPTFEESKRSKSKIEKFRKPFEKLEKENSENNQQSGRLKHMNFDSRVFSSKQSSSSSSSQKRDQIGECHKIMISTDSFCTCRSQPIVQVLQIAQGESENVQQDILSFQAFERNSPRTPLNVISPAVLNKEVEVNESYQSESLQLQEIPQQVNSYNPPTKASQMRKSQVLNSQLNQSFSKIGFEQQKSQRSSCHQRINEDGIRNIVRNSMNNHRARDEGFDQSSSFGHLQQDLQYQQDACQSHRNNTPEALQFNPQINRVHLTQRYPQLARNLQQTIRDMQLLQNIEQQNIEQNGQIGNLMIQERHLIEEILVENLIGANQSASVNFDPDQRNVQQINQIIRASNGARDPLEEKKQLDDRINQYNQGLCQENENFEGEDQLEEFKQINENEKSFEHELQDDNNQFTTNESILINKVNEMQIKTSRFDNQRNKYLFRSSALLQHHAMNQDQNNFFNQISMNQHQRGTQQQLLLTYLQHKQKQSQQRKNNLAQGMG